MWTRYLKYGALAILIGMALSLLVLTQARAHTTHLSGCAIFGGSDFSTLKQMDVPFYDEGTGLLLERYDRNGDGKVDLGVLSQVEAVSKQGEQIFTRHAKIPTFYFLGEGPDLVYIDKVGKGHCQDIVLYEDLRMPHDAGVDFSEPSKTVRGRAI
jgi:hypothetical protein